MRQWGQRVNGGVVRKARTACRTAADLIPQLEAERVPIAPVNDYAEALADSQIAHRELFHTIDHPTAGRIRVVGPPRIMTGPEADVGPPPLLGQHTDDVLASWLGWDAEKIERFNATRVSDG